MQSVIPKLNVKLNNKGINTNLPMNSALSGHRRLRPPLRCVFDGVEV